MATDFYLLPNTPENTDPAIARDWIDYQQRQFAMIPAAPDFAAEDRKRRLADLLLRMKPDFEEFHLRYEQIAAAEQTSVDEARRRYRHIEINGPGMQFTLFDQYVTVSVYSSADVQELDALLAALSTEGQFLLFDPQSDEVIDLADESCT